MTNAMEGLPRAITITIPLTPPSVNHYTSHGGGFHRKSVEAKAWESAFPLFSQKQYVVSDCQRFSVTLDIFLGPNERGDSDNFPKCVLDCIAKAGMLRNAKLKPVSDAWVKKLSVNINDMPKDRKLGPMTRITIEALTAESL